MAGQAAGTPAGGLPVRLGLPPGMAAWRLEWAVFRNARWALSHLHRSPWKSQRCACAVVTGPSGFEEWEHGPPFLMETLSASPCKEGECDRKSYWALGARASV